MSITVRRDRSRVRVLAPKRPRKTTTPEAVRDIRRRAKEGEKHDSIAMNYGITASAVSQIASGKRRADVA